MRTIGLLVCLLLLGARLVLRPGLDRGKVLGFVLVGLCFFVCLLLMLLHPVLW